MLFYYVLVCCLEQVCYCFQIASVAMENDTTVAWVGVWHSQ